MRSVEAGIDPIKQNQTKKAHQSEDRSFEVVARAWYAKRSIGKSKKYSQNMSRLETYIFPALGGRAIDEIDAADILDCLEKIVGLGHIETAYKTRRTCGQIFRYAIVTRRTRYNPAADLAEALPANPERHYAAITNPEEVGTLLQAVWAYEGMSMMVRSALRVLPYLFVRLGNLTGMRWADINLETAEWLIPAEVMKMREDHLVPLPWQVVEIIQSVEPVSNGHEWVFTGQRPKRPLSANTLNLALRTMGVNTQEQHTSHGWRATARTLLHERLNYPPEVIEHQLAHRVPDMLGSAYNRTRFIEQRREMMQRYADYLDSLRTGTGKK